MCIIVVKPKDEVLSRAYLENMWHQNPHGAGFMYAEKGQVKIVKGLMTLKGFLNVFEGMQHNRKMVAHFRTKTHGRVSAKLTHPFWIKNQEMGMVHNGVIPKYGILSNGEESDTSLYAEALSKRYPNPLESLTDPKEHAAIKAEIGWSKLVFMDGDGETLIINSNLGHWHNGCWFSNRDYLGGYNYGNYYGNYYGHTNSQSRFYEAEEANQAIDNEAPSVSVNETEAQGKVDEEWARILAEYQAKYLADSKELL